ncbi:hypothetical protein EBZ80_10585 [bacterium]|nr:hypothetical protein [bacterium]
MIKASAEKERIRAEIIRLHVHGRRISEIAAELGCVKGLVSKTIMAWRLRAEPASEET